MDGVYNANTRQGTFPSNNTKRDEYLGSAPVTEFYKDGNGVCQMIDNVWECLLKMSPVVGAKTFDTSGEVGIITPTSNTNILYPNTVIPIIKGNLEVGGAYLNK